MGFAQNVSMEFWPKCIEKVLKF